MKEWALGCWSGEVFRLERVAACQWVRAAACPLEELVCRSEEVPGCQLVRVRRL